MIWVIVVGICVGVILLAMGVSAFCTYTKIGQKLDRYLDDLWLVPLFVPAIAIVATIGLSIATTFTFKPAVDKQECERVEVPMLFKDVYYHPDNQEFYVTYQNFDALVPTEDLREPNEKERTKIVEYVEENYSHWDELYQAAQAAMN